MTDLLGINIKITFSLPFTNG